MMTDSSFWYFHMFLLLVMVSLKVDGQIFMRPNPWGTMYGNRHRILQPIPKPRILTCSDVVCPDPRTRCMDAGGAEQAKCVDPCQGEYVRGIRGCPRIYTPLCGTDGVVYSNACYLEAAMCLDRSLDVCVVMAGYECKDRRCVSADRRTGTETAAISSAEYNVGPRSYSSRSGYGVGPHERLVDTSYLVRNQY